jgi:VWFA-related protein
MLGAGGARAHVRVATLAMALTGAVVTSAQNPAPALESPVQPTFRVDVDYIEVDTVVTDKQGHFIRDLKQEDFEVLEDGKPQPIRAFSLVDIPIERAESPVSAGRPVESVAADVRTNERPFDGRIYVLVLDALHTNPSRTPRVKAVARQFIERNLGENDLMAVVHVGSPTNTGQAFTNSRRLLLASIDKFVGGKLRSATLERYDQSVATAAQRQRMQSQGARPQQLDDPLDADRSYNAQVMLDSLSSIVDWMGGIRGRRKALLFFSEGIDYDIYDFFGQTVSSANSNHKGADIVIQKMRDTIAAATRANVSFFTVDPRGLTQLGDEAIELNGPAAADQANLGNGDALGIGNDSLQRELARSLDSLRAMAEDTGGLALVNSNDFANGFDRIVRDNSSYYVLAYAPPSDKRDGKFHTIDVKISRPNVEVRTRRGYASPTGKPIAPPADLAAKASMELRNTLNSPLPVSGLTLSVFAAPFKGEAPNASILLGAELRGRDLRLGDADSNGSLPDKVEVSYVVGNLQGKVKAASTATLDLRLKPETGARVTQSGLRLLDRLSLPPGSYQLRVAARDGNGGTVGSVLYDLVVPNFNDPRVPLAMSGIVLTSPSASGTVTARSDETLKAVLPGPPAALRRFQQSDEITFFAEIYDTELKVGHKVDITTTVLTDEGREKFKAETERSSEELPGTRGRYGHTIRLSLKDFEPGQYLLRLEARSRLGQGSSVSRDLQFTVTD